MFNWGVIHFFPIGIVLTPFPAVIATLTALPTPTRACSMLTLLSQGSFISMARSVDSDSLPLLSFVAVMVVKPITLSVSPPLLQGFDDDVLLLWLESLSRTSVTIRRKRGRRTATEAANIPVPGSAVAQMVALIEAARDRQLHARICWSYMVRAYRRHRCCRTTGLSNRPCAWC